jgi:hypothetical protein
MAVADRYDLVPFDGTYVGKREAHDYEQDGERKRAGQVLKFLRQNADGEPFLFEVREGDATEHGLLTLKEGERVHLEPVAVIGTGRNERSFLIIRKATPIAAKAAQAQ